MRRIIIICALILAGCLHRTVPAYAQNAGLFTDGKFQGFDSNGNPLAAGKVCTYAAGTTTSLLSYTTAAGASGVANTNPVTLDSAGRASIWLLPSSYKVLLYASGTGNTCNGSTVGSLIWSVDNIPGGFLGQPGWVDAGTYVKPTTLTDDIYVGGLQNTGLTNAGNLYVVGTHIHLTSDNTANANDLDISSNGAAVLFNARTFGTATAIPFIWRNGGTSWMKLTSTGQLYLGPAPTTISSGTASIDGAILIQGDAVQWSTNSSAMLNVFNYLHAGAGAYSAGAIAGYNHVGVSGTANGQGVKGIAYQIDDTAGSVASSTVINVSGLNGVYGRTTTYAAGTIDYAVGVQGVGALVYGPGTTTRSYALQAQWGGITAEGIIAGGSTVTEVGLRIEDYELTNSTNKWAIQSAGGKSYHVGNFMIGSATAPSTALHVVGSTSNPVIFDTSNATNSLVFKSSSATTRGSIFTSVATIGFVLASGTTTAGLYTSATCGVNGDCFQVTSGTTSFIVDATASATATNVWLFYNGNQRQVAVGAADSCTAGFRCLRIAN